MFLKLLIISAFILICSIVFFSIRLLLKKNGQFPQIHIGRNKEMIRHGIRCAKKTDTGFNPSIFLKGCAACHDEEPGEEQLQSRQVTSRTGNKLKVQ